MSTAKPYSAEVPVSKSRVRRPRSQPSDLIDVARAAEILGVSQPMVRRLITEGGAPPAGKLPAQRIAGRWVLREAAVRRYAQLERPTGRPKALPD